MSAGFSFAGDASGNKDPDEVRIVDADESTDEGKPDNHLIVMWSGDEYSFNNTWLSAHQEHVMDLEEVR